MGAFERRDWATAEAEARAALATSASSEARVALIDALVAQGRYPEALEADAAIAEPTSRSLALRGVSLFNLGRPDEGGAALQACLQTARDAHEDWLVIGQLLFELGKRGEALDALQRALIQSPQSAQALTLLGRALTGVDDPMAKRRLEQSLSLDAEQPGAWLALSQLLFGQRDAAGAKEAARRALEIAPQWSEAQKAYNQASIITAKSPRLLLALVPVIAGTALAASAFRHLTDGAAWPRLLGALVLLAAGLGVEVAMRRARRRRGTALERELGPGGDKVEQIDAPSDARTFFTLSRWLFGCAGGAALLGGALLVALVVFLRPAAFHPGMLTLALPFVLAAVLWWEARQTRRRAERAAHDRS